MKLSRTLVSILLALVLLLGVSAMAEGTSGLGDRVLRVSQSQVMSEDQIGIPWLSTQNNMGWSLAPALERLFVYQYGEVVPWLCEGYTVADDGVTYTLKVREGVKFHDGSDLNAEVVAWNLEGAQKAGHSVVNFESIEAVSDYEVKLVLPRPDIFFIQKLSSSLSGFVVSKQSYDEHGEEWMLMHPVGTGAYQFSAYEAGTKIAYTAFDGYWGEGPYLDGIEVIWFDDTSTEATAFANGELDIMWNAKSTMEETVKALTSDYVIETGAPSTIDYTWLKNDDESIPMHDVRVRKAIAYAIDWPSYCEYTMKNFGLKYTNQPSYEGSMFYNEEIVGYPYDLEKAQALMAEAGYADGFTITWRSRPDYKEAAEYFQAMMTQLNITVNIEYLEGATFNQYFYGDFDGVFVNPMSFSPNEVTRAIERFSKDGDPGIDGYCYAHTAPSDEYFAAMHAVATATTMEDVAANYKAAMKDLIDVNCNIIPIRANTATAIVRSNVTGDHSGCSANCWTPNSVNFE